MPDETPPADPETPPPGFPSARWTAFLLGLASLILVGIVVTVVVCELTGP